MSNETEQVENEQVKGTEDTTTYKFVPKTIKKENLPTEADPELANEVHFTEDGGLYVYTKDGEQVQVGCTREEFESLSDATSEFSWSDREW